MVRRLLPIVALLLSVSPARATPALPEWLAGNWSMVDGAIWADEVWTGPKGATMLGIARRGFGPDLESWSMMRIVRKPDGAVVLTVQPSGGAATVDYAMTLATGEHVEFTSASGHKPQRIRFWREGQLLMSETSGIGGEDSERLNYRPIEFAPAH